MKMETKYQFNSYFFLSRIAFYDHKMLDRNEVLEHLKYWFPEYDWDFMNMEYSYKELVRLLRACVIRAETEYEVQQG